MSESSQIASALKFKIAIIHFKIYHVAGTPIDFQLQPVFSWSNFQLKLLTFSYLTSNGTVQDNFVYAKPICIA